MLGLRQRQCKPHTHTYGMFSKHSPDDDSRRPVGSFLRGCFVGSLGGLGGWLERREYCSLVVGSCMFRRSSRRVEGWVFCSPFVTVVWTLGFASRVTRLFRRRF